jgi:predicted ATPase
VPSLAIGSPHPARPVDDLVTSDAVRLFTARAQGVQPAFALTLDNASLVGQICERLDGIPLAIELAATRLKALSLEQIVARLDQRFRLLTGGSRTALPRQQTLSALVGWSYDLLTAPERTLFNRLAVFAGASRSRRRKRWAQTRAMCWICSVRWWTSHWWSPTAGRVALSATGC